MSTTASEAPAPKGAPASTADLVAGATKILRAYGQDATADLAERKLAGEDRTRSVVVVGEVKRGKSALVNALIGCGELSVEHVQHSTATSIRFFEADDDHPEGTADLVFPDGTRRIPFAEVSDWTSTHGRFVTDPTVESLPIGAAVPVASEHIRGLTILDTPGSGGLDARHATMAVQSAETAAVLVVVVDASTPITEPEMNFLRDAAASVENVVLAVSKTDKNLVRWHPIVAEDRDLIARHLGRDIPVLGVSSVRAQAALRLPPGPERDRAIHCSGIPDLRELIRERLAAADVRPATDALRTSLEGLRRVEKRIDAELTAVRDGEKAVPDLSAELARLEALKNDSQQWEQHLQRDITLARQRALSHLDDRLARVRDDWTTRINKSSMAVLRQSPQTFTAQMQTDLLATMSSTAEVFLADLERITTELFETHDEWIRIRDIAVASMQTDPMVTSEVKSRRQDLFDPSILTMGMIGTSMLGAVIGVGAIAGVVWVGVNLGFRAMRAGKNNLLTWLRETIGTTRTMTSRMLESALATSRPEIVISRRRLLQEGITSLQTQISEARKAAKADAAAREANVERLSKNLRITRNRIAPIVAALGSGGADR